MRLSQFATSDWATLSTALPHSTRQDTVASATPQSELTTHALFASARSCARRASAGSEKSSQESVFGSTPSQRPATHAAYDSNSPPPHDDGGGRSQASSAAQTAAVCCCPWATTSATPARERKPTPHS